MTKTYIFLFIFSTTSALCIGQTKPVILTEAEKAGMAEHDNFLKKYNESFELEFLADKKVKSGDYQGAIFDYTTAMKKTTLYLHELYFKRGLTKTKLGDYRGGISDYTKAIQLNPKYAEAYNNRSAAKLNLKDHLGAKADANKAISINPNIAEAYYNRGAAKINLGEKESGCLDLSKAGELGDSLAYKAIKEYCD
jgi:tetratricopeptide (TPR) repeat protein